MKTLEEHLKHFFGYNEFRHNQKEIINAILKRQDVLAILPTGAGKSICYQLPALIMDGLAIVISPLISLMQDQVLSLTKNGISAALLNSSLHVQDMHMVLNNLQDYKLLYVAPERLADKSFIEKLQQTEISFIAIDEAHCISQWGHSFRPEYRQLSFLKTAFPKSNLIALTATATKEVQEDIISQLLLKAPHIEKASFDRPNLTVLIDFKENEADQLNEFLEKHPDEPGIIYAATRKKVDEAHEMLSRIGFKVEKYHAGMTDSERANAQNDFVYGRVNLMVATLAFGMGIHKPDIRFIVHLDMPRSIEQYYQEIGRAGRDGLPAECLMLYSPKDMQIYEYFLKDIPEQKVRDSMKVKTDTMYKLCRTWYCRRKGLLEYFGENYPTETCSNCDNCIHHMEEMDATIDSQKILSCVYRVQQRFGAKYVIEVLRGSKSKNILERGHETLSTYGLMKDQSEGDLLFLINALLDQGYLKRSEGDYPVLQWTEHTRNVTSGGQKVILRKYKSLSERMITREALKSSHEWDYDRELFKELVLLRRKWAADTNVPAFVVFGDRVLIEMAVHYPTSQEAMLALNGIGPAKWEKYGESFLNTIQAYCLKHPNLPKKKVSYRTAPVKNASSEESAKLFQAGNSIEEIASKRNLSPRTILDHLAEQITFGKDLNIGTLVSIEKQEHIRKAIAAVGVEKLTPIKQALPEEYTYDEIKLVAAFSRRPK